MIGPTREHRRQGGVSLVQAGKALALRAPCDRTLPKGLLIMPEQLRTFLSIRGSREAAGGLMSFSGENHRQRETIRSGLNLKENLHLTGYGVHV